MIKRNILSLIFIPYIRLYIHNYEISPTLPKYHYWKFTMKKYVFSLVDETKNHKEAQKCNSETFSIHYDYQN